MSSTANTTHSPTVVDYDPFAGSEISRVVPTTEPQREIWLANRLGREASLAYNESVSLKFSGPLNTEYLQKAFDELVERHEALRATFSANGEELLIGAAITLIVDFHDVTDINPEQQDRALAEACTRAVESPFDIESGPLIRAELWTRTNESHMLIITAHHIVCDGWSFGLLIRDLAEFYARQTGSVGDSLPLVSAYSDYAEAQRSSDGSTARLADEAWWVSHFTGNLPVLDLPLDRPRPAWRTFRSKRVDVLFDAALVAEVRKFGAKKGAGLFGTMLAGFSAMLYRVTGIDDVVIGIPAAGQSVDGLDNLVGHCVTLLPIRIAIEADAKLELVVARAQSALLDAYEHQSLTFGSLLKKLSVVRDASRLPLVSVVFNIDQALDTNTINFPGLRFEFESLPRSYENFELFVNAVPAQGGLKLECQYNADLFDESTVKRLIGHFENLMRTAIAGSKKPVSRLSIISPAERNALLNRHTTKHDFPVIACLHESFSAQAIIRGEAIAVSCEGHSLTYAELEDRSNRLANRLVRMGVGPDILVGLNVERSHELLVCILGVLKAGGGYLPLDPDYPGDRIAFIVGDAQAPVLLTQASLTDRLPRTNAKILRIDADWQEIAAEAGTAPPTKVGPNNLAYVIYTSGSTGKPKGVEITHANVARLFAATQEWYAFGPDDTWTMFHSYAFDFSVWEIWGALLYGGRVVVVPYLVSRSPDAFRELLALEHVTILNQTPSAFRQLITADENAPIHQKLNLRYVIFGGEALDTRMLKPWYERHADNAPTLVNMYGITETTVHVTYRPLERSDSESTASPIGLPIPDLSLYLLDQNLEPVPVGVAGELHVGGAGLARGYLNRPDLTATKFIPNPFRDDAGARLYKSGDIARYLANGSLEFVGRVDNQVKVRGHRIELGEIDAQLTTHSGIAHALTIIREDRPGDVRLVSYIVSRENAGILEDDLKVHLKKTLPDYMIPAHFIAVASIPLTENGKINRKALPPPGSLARNKADFVMPRTDLEKTVLAEMETSLGLPGISMHDDFFALGGHSLLAAQLTSRLNQMFKSHLSMRHLFEAPTAERLAELIAAGDTIQRKPVLRRTDRSSAPLTIMQERLWFLEQLYPGRVTYNGPSAHRLSGPLNEYAFQQAFSEMMRRQPSLRTCFIGDGDLATQQIHEDIGVSFFPAEDLRLVPVGERESKLMTRLEELTAQTFDLSKTPLFKAHMLKLADDEHVLFFMAHHIIWDGWSFDLLYTELSALYTALLTGKSCPLPELKIDYGDFAAWHRDWMQSEEFTKQLQFWRGRIHAIGEARALPTDKPRQSGSSGEGNTEKITINKAMTVAIHDLARKLDTTVFIIALSLYVVMLHGFARQRHLVIGTPVRGRNSVELESIMGFFNTLLPLPVTIDPGETFDALVSRVKVIVVDSLKYPDVPLEQLAQELASTNEGPGGALYQALFSFQDARQRTINWGGLAHQNILIFQRGATEDLGMWFVESGDGLHGGLTYNTDLFTSETAQKLRERYLSLASAVVASPVATITQLVGPADEAALTRAREAIAKPARPIAKPATDAQPSTETEKILAELWCQQLKLPQVSTTDNFFDLGGHSLLAMQSILAMEQKTGKRVDRSRFIFETLAQIAKSYDDAKPEPPRKPGGLWGLFSGLLGGKKS